MSDLLTAGALVPIAFVSAVVVYAIVFVVARRRGHRPRWFVMVAEFALVGWSIMFIAVTQLISFGNGMGDRLNLVPFQSFVTAFQDGLVNAPGVWQFALNIAMMVPFGVLMPIVFPQRYRSFATVVFTGAFIAAATELSQLLTFRTADVDDLIANMAGAAVGYSVFVLARWVATIRIPVDSGARRVAAGRVAAIAVIAAVVVPYALVVSIDAAAGPAGHVYYGALRPAHVSVGVDLLPNGPSRSVYRVTTPQSVHALERDLRKRTGFNGPCENTGGILVCHGGKGEAFFIYDYNRWSSTDHYGTKDSGGMPAPISTSTITAVTRQLQHYGIDPERVAYSGPDTGWADGRQHLQFHSTESTGNSIRWGTVEVAVDGDGHIADISDQRLNGRRVQTVTTISPKAAVTKAEHVGVRRVSLNATVIKVDPSYYLNEAAGYLIPTWQITSTVSHSNSVGVTWEPNIDARSN